MVVIWMLIDVTIPAVLLNMYINICHFFACHPSKGKQKIDNFSKICHFHVDA